MSSRIITLNKPGLYVAEHNATGEQLLVSIGGGKRFESLTIKGAELEPVLLAAPWTLLRALILVERL